MFLVGTPSYTGTVTFQYMTSLMGMVHACNKAGVQACFHHLAGESLVTRARNLIANAFLRREDCTHLLFIDADLGFPEDAALRYLHSGKDVVCGIYPVKYLDVEKLRHLPPGLSREEAMASSLFYTVKLKDDAVTVHDGLVPVEYGPAGFMMIKREVFVEMAAAYPQLRYHNSYVNSGDKQYDNWAFFDTAIDGETGDYLPEDYAFCKRWTAIGGEIYGDVLSRFTHSGQCDYVGDYPTYLRHCGDCGQSAIPAATPEAAASDKDGLSSLLSCTKIGK